MKKNKLLSFLFGIKRSKFEITDQELDLIQNNNYGKINATTETVSEFEDSIAWYDRIYEEIYSKTQGELTKYWKLKISESNTYLQLKKEPIPIKREFFYWLTFSILEIYNKKNRIDGDDNRIIEESKKELISLLIRNDLKLSEDQFIYFITFWKNHSTIFYPIGVFLNHLKRKAKKDGISENLKNFLESALNWNQLQTDYYSGYYKRAREIIEETLRINKNLS